MIRSFRHKGLAQLFLKNYSKGISADLLARCRSRLTAIHQALVLEELNLLGFDFHRLRGKRKRYTVHVNGPWCITFEWIDGEARLVDLEQYH